MKQAAGKSASDEMKITTANRQRVQKINLRQLEKITRALLAELELEKSGIGICMVAAPEMTRLNGASSNTRVDGCDYV